MQFIAAFLIICFCIGFCNAIFSCIIGIGKLMIDNPLAFIGVILSICGLILLIKYLF